MKANKKTLKAVKNFLQNREGWDLDEVKDDIVAELQLLKSKEMKDASLATDECSINWGEEEVCVLCNFIDAYTDKLLEKMCNVLDSFVGEDISCYLEEDEE
jgi:uncharacterized protein YacL (UPF0231 family)